MAKAAAATEDVVDPTETPAAPAAPTGPLTIEGPGGDKGKHIREFTADYKGSRDGIPNGILCTKVCDESEAMRLLRLHFKLGSKDGRFAITETEESLKASLLRLKKREDAKKKKTPTGGL